jgi:AbiV family abortive infection protein
MNRNDLQEISKLRMKEAKLLLDNGFYAGAYYLLGYSVECAIKACIAKKVKKYDFPDKDLGNESHKHNLEKLLQTAGLWHKITQDMKKNLSLDNNWANVKDWSETTRYTVNITQKKAEDFYASYTARRNGIYSWIKKFW